MTIYLPFCWKCYHTWGNRIKSTITSRDLSYYLSIFKEWPYKSIGGMFLYNGKLNGQAAGGNKLTNFPSPSSLHTAWLFAKVTYCQAYSAEKSSTGISARGGYSCQRKLKLVIFVYLLVTILLYISFVQKRMIESIWFLIIFSGGNHEVLYGNYGKGGGGVKFYHYKKRGGEYKHVWGSFNTGAWSLTHTEAKGRAKSVHPL